MPKLNIKLSNGTSTEVTLDSLTDGTVMDLKKNVLAPAIDIPAENQRVVYKGRILKDGDALTAVGLLDGVALHVVRSGAAPAPAPAPAAAPTTTTTPAPQQQQQQDSNSNNNNTSDASSSTANPNPFASLFGGAGGNNNQQQQQGGGAPNPFASMMGGAGGMGGGGAGGLGGLAGMMGGMGGGGNINPNQMAAAAQMMQNNPQMQQMMQQLIQNPQMMRQVLQMDPTINSMPEPQRSQTLDLMTNPLMLQGMMSSFGGGGGGMGGMGGGMGGANPFAAMMGGAGGNNNNNTDQQQGGTGTGAGAGGVPPPPPQAMPQAPQMSTEEARTRYSSQLQQLQTMGFPNEDANIRALIMSQGNVDFAVARLLGD